MKTDWDYTDLADAYIKRSDYAESALDEIVIVAKLQKDAKICDYCPKTSCDSSSITYPQRNTCIGTMIIDPSLIYSNKEINDICVQNYKQNNLDLDYLLV